MRVTNREKVKINFFEDTTVNQAFKVCENVSVLAFSVRKDTLKVSECSQISK
jgi:hypothetical protein